MHQCTSAKYRVYDAPVHVAGMHQRAHRIPITKMYIEPLGADETPGQEDKALLSVDESRLLNTLPVRHHRIPEYHYVPKVPSAVIGNPGLAV